MPQTNPTQLSKQQIEEMLFDGLMERIEPKLMVKNRETTARELDALAPEERKEMLLWFQDAYEIFYENWPSYLQEAMDAVTVQDAQVSAALSTDSAQ